MDLASITPVVGISSGAVRRVSRGYTVTGKTHAVLGPVDVDDMRAQLPITTVCGRTLIVVGTWEQGTWPKYLAMPNRTHETGNCLRCVTKTELARLDQMSLALGRKG